MQRLLGSCAARIGHDSDNCSLLRFKNLILPLAIRYGLTEKSLAHVVSISHCLVHEVRMLLLLFFFAASLAESPLS